MSEATQDPYEVVSAFRSKERTQMISSIRDFIEEAQKRAKLKNTPSRERVKWMNLAGKLIWYKDQILRSMTHEAMEREVAELKRRVNEQHPQVTPRRMIFGPSNVSRPVRTKRPASATQVTGRG